jgi:hypothetical protein
MVIIGKRFDNSGNLAIELESLHETVGNLLSGCQKTFNFFYGLHGVEGEISRSQLAMIEIDRKLKLYKKEVTKPTCKSRVFK